jgi:hypothetical protein
MSVGPWLILVGCMALGCAFVYTVLWVFVWTSPRERQLRKLAKHLGYAFVSSRRSDAGQQVTSPFLRSASSLAYNVLLGRCQGHRVSILDLTGGQSKQPPPYWTYLVLDHEKRLPSLLVRPRASVWNSELMPATEEIRLESMAFGHAFRVVSEDRKFAYDVLHPRMMEYLLAHPGYSMEVHENRLALGFERALAVKEFPARLNQLAEIRKLMPDYLFNARTEETR